MEQPQDREDVRLESNTEESSSRRRFLRQTAGIASGFALASLLPNMAEAQGNKFANPPELVHEKGVLKGVIQLTNSVRKVPNMADTQLRLFQGWNLSQSSGKAAPVAASVGPGPTLRARVGGRMDLMFLNNVDDSKFTYTQTAAQGNQFGCDAS